MVFWNSCFFHDPADVGNLISGSSAFSKTILNIWKFTVHILLKPGLENFEHYFTSVWDEYNCAVVWAFFGVAFLWDWNENWPFPVLWPLLSFPNLLVILFANIFSLSTGSFFLLWIVSCTVKKLISLIAPHLFIFAFASFALADWPKKILLHFMSENVLSMFSSGSLVCQVLYIGI